MTDNSNTTDIGSVKDLIQGYQALVDRLSGKGGQGAKVKDRKELLRLHAAYARYSGDDETLLSDVTKLQALLAKAQELVK